MSQRRDMRRHAEWERRQLAQVRRQQIASKLSEDRRAQLDGAQSQRDREEEAAVLDRTSRGVDRVPERYRGGGQPVPLTLMAQGELGQVIDTEKNQVVSAPRRVRRQMLREKKK